MAANLHGSEPILIGMNGDVEEVQPLNGTDFTLEELYKLLDCDMVQMVSLTDGRIMLMDEDGKLKPSNRMNVLASRLYHSPHDFIVGAVVVCDPDKFK